MNLAIIPARKSSKRIKDKNIINFFGEPIIAKTIKLIKNTKLFRRVIVTSDCEKILAISKKYGAEIYLRKKKLAGDKIPIANVIKDLLKNSNLNINNVFYFYPTSIFIKKRYLLDSLKILKKKPNSMVLSICEYSHPIERSLIMNSKNEIKFKYKKNILKQTQYFQKSYYDAGQFGLAKKKYFLDNNVKNKKIIGYVLNDYDACDIDNYKDLKKAKFLFKKLKNE
jgi:pseudaminic acid cytidylyltransferase